MNGALPDAKDGLVASNLDAFETYRTFSSMGPPSGLLISRSLALMPLYTLACMRSFGFRSGVKADERSHALNMFKTKPLGQVI